MEYLPGFMKSKKFIALVVGVAAIKFQAALGLEPDQAAWVAKMCVGYIVGQGVADMGKEKAKVLSGLDE